MHTIGERVVITTTNLIARPIEEIDWDPEFVADIKRQLHDAIAANCRSRIMGAIRGPETTYPIKQKRQAVLGCIAIDCY